MDFIEVVDQLGTSELKVAVLLFVKSLLPAVWLSVPSSLNFQYPANPVSVPASSV